MSEFRRRLMMQRMQSNKLPTDGVYIQSIDSEFYTLDEWTLPNAQANGVAVIDSNHPDGGFIMSIQESDNEFQWGTVDKVLVNVGSSRKDYKGFSNTEQIIIQDNPACEAAIYCKNFIFPNEKSGYLGAVNEFSLAQSTLKINLINDCLLKLNGDTIRGTGSTVYWTSTQFNTFSPGKYAFGNLGNYLEKSYKLKVRPFTTL